MLGGEVGKERERDETRAMIIAVGGRGRNISLPRFSLEMSSEEGEGGDISRRFRSSAEVMSVMLSNN